MKHKQQVLTGMCLVVLAIGSSAWADNPSSVQLQKASDAFLAGDFAGMTKQMRAALEMQPTDPLVRQNVSDLLRKAYEVRGGGAIPVDWHLPSEIRNMNLVIKRTEREFAEYSVMANGGLAHSNSIKQLKVTRYPDQVVLDKQAGIGSWEEMIDPQDGTPEFNIKSRSSRDRIPGGLYLIRIETADGAVTDGWAILDDEYNATASPKVYSPAYNETIQTGNPTLRFEDFRSPQYQPSERRAVWMEVARMEAPQYKWDPKWNLWLDPPSIEQITVGHSDAGLSVDKLEDGHYIFFIGFKERIKFGDIRVGREASTARPFIVKH